MILSILPWLVAIATTAASIIGVLLHKRATDAKVTKIQAEADQKVANATTTQDAAVVKAAQAEVVNAKSNEAVAQASADAATERTNVEHETASATRVDNDKWMLDNGFIKAADTTTAEAAGRGTGSAGSDTNR